MAGFGSGGFDQPASSGGSAVTAAFSPPGPYGNLAEVSSLAVTPGHYYISTCNVITSTSFTHGVYMNHTVATGNLTVLVTDITGVAQLATTGSLAVASNDHVYPWAASFILAAGTYLVAIAYSGASTVQTAASVSYNRNVTAAYPPSPPLTVPTSFTSGFPEFALS
jgi:hypothetical protein